MAETRKMLGSILVALKVCDVKQVQAALQLQKTPPFRGKKLGEILVEKGWSKPHQITEALARQHNLPCVSLKNVKVKADVINLVPRNVAIENMILPIKSNGKQLTIAMTDPFDVFTLDNLKFILNLEVEPVLATKQDIEEAIQTYYGTVEKKALVDAIQEATQTQMNVDLRTDGTGEDGEPVDDAPIIKFVQLIIAEAVKARASDIHVEPMEGRVRIRYRVDGVCQEVNSAPKKLQGSVLSRLKIMSEMDIAEKRKPQDGRIKIQVDLGQGNLRDLDIRVSALPATHGESIVMRLLDKKGGLPGLEELGFHPSDYKRFKTMIKRPNGIFLVTGPTGSGKTTTLYAALKELNRPDVKIITAENPVEYNLAGINQAQVRAGIGLDFARILRAMLRQAPNIILVGEIRDQETAEIAIQAALTGHLVFSTLHTNDAAGALTRLIDIGVKPFLVASSVQAIMAQRLVRILCPKCRVRVQPEEGELAALGLRPEDARGKTVYGPAGCDACKGTGYKGRKGIYELLEMNGPIRDLTFKRASSVKLQEQARMMGMVTLLEDGIRKIFDGMTSVAEVLTLTRREDISY